MIIKTINNILSSQKFINLLIFSFILSLFINLMHTVYNENNINLNGKNKNYSFKESVSIKLSSEESYSQILNGNCEVTGDMHDRHKVRWVKSLFLKKVFQKAYEIKDTSPYYLNILMHSLLIFLTLIILNRIYDLEKYFTLLFLLYITFIFNHYIGEYSYSIFEMFFISAALYFSKKDKIIPFIIICILAALNRESGFIIILSWLVFNNDYKKFIYAGSITVLSFSLLNWSIFECLINPKFFIPLEYQVGQINVTDLFKLNLFSLIKVVLINFGFPFGLVVYYLINTRNKNNILILITLIYFISFLVAAPMHHVSIRMLILPIIFTAAYFSKLKN